MQRSCEASLKCLQIKGSPYGNTLEGFPGFKEEIGAHPDSQKMQQCQMNCFESQFYPFPLQTRFQYAPFNMFSQVSPGQLEACFQTYVRPTCNQLLSEFCKDLTGIQQIQVDRGVTLSEALLRHDKWLENKGIKNTSFAVVTWSNWDCRVMLESECRFKKIRKPPYFNRWINLKVPFCEIFGGARCLKEAVEMSGLEWQGRAHCGLDDAKNTARLLALLMHRGIRFSITNSLMWHTTDSSLPCKQSPENLSFSPPCKLKEMRLPVFPYPPFCFCGVKSSKGMVRKPGPKQGSLFFGCGNWTAARGARCHYFEWASP
ncbi:3'-5' EXONUCLEASE ERI1-RELATED [Salix purpurea]|uniref:3'-5' EXONUCLEASE ERI1-RELATED n=1 Tax=Salix purpurea TaxID=77065 RepID=A0A9Q0T8X5_SALPP|nr:3'-5' EXONUCLEASE ERI1-RELATED [Salix purpurea]